MNLQYKDKVAFQFNGHYVTGEVLSVYSDFPAVRCRDSKNLDYVVRPDECISIEEMEKRKFEAVRQKMQLRYQPLFEAYTKFNGDRTKMAAELKCRPAVLGVRIRAAKRWGFIV